MIMRLDPDNAIAVEKANAILSELEAPRKFAVPGFQPAFEKPEMSSAATDGEKGTDEAPTGAPVSEGSDHSPGPDAEGAVDLYATGMIEPTSVRGPSGDTLPESDDFIEPAGYATENPASAPASHPEFLSPFTDEEIGEIVTRSAVKGYSAGETIVREGDTGTSVFLIKQGRVSVVSHIFGREINLATLSAGDLFGEVAFLTGRPRTANVIATEAAEVYKINKDLLDEIIEKRPEIMSQVNEIYNERVQDTIRKIKE